MPPSPPPLVNAAEAARHYGVAVGSVYRWVSEDGIPVHGSRVRRRYDLRDLQAAYDRRHRAEWTTVTCSEENEHRMGK